MPLTFIRETYKSTRVRITGNLMMNIQEILMTVTMPNPYISNPNPTHCQGFKIFGKNERLAER